MKATYIKDRDIKSIKLSRGMWLIDGEPIDIQELERTCEFKNTVQKVDTTRIVIKYVDADSNELSVEDYLEQRTKLASFKDEEGCFTNIDKEYEYKKLVQKWNAIYKTIEVVSEPLTIDFQERVLDSGNKFIISEFANSSQYNTDLFIYKRPLALLSIVNSVFSSLGMKYVGDASYEKTKNEKIWGNSTHSIIQYVTAFGKYIFSKRYDSKYVNDVRGKLDVLLAKYNEDEKDITETIKNLYNEHFNAVDLGQIKFKEIAEKLRVLELRIRDVEPKKTSYETKSQALVKVREIQDIIQHYFNLNQ